MKKRNELGINTNKLVFDKEQKVFIEDLGNGFRRIVNRFFVYEGDILRAAQPKLSTAIKYMGEGRKMLWGTPEKHTHDITEICKRLKFNYGN